MITGADYLYYYTFSQKYLIPTYQGNTYYQTNNNGSLGNGITVQSGFIKQMEKFYISPKIIVPVYQTLRTDRVFLEDTKKFAKWFNGIGISVTIGKSFK